MAEHDNTVVEVGPLRLSAPNRLLGLLALLGIAFYFGTQNIVDLFRDIRRALARDAEDIGFAALFAARVTLPRALRGLWWLLVVLAFCLALVLLGLSAEKGVLVFLGGLVFWLALIVLFVGIETAALVVTKGISMAETSLGYALSLITAGLSWFGLTETRRGKFDLVNEEEIQAKLKRVRLGTYLVWWLGIGLLTVFPFWSVALLLAPILAGFLILADRICKWCEWDVKGFWKVVLRLVIVGLILAPISFLFPDTSHQIRLAVRGLDAQVKCRVWADTEHCRKERVDDVYAGLASLARETEDMATKLTRWSGPRRSETGGTGFEGLPPAPPPARNGEANLAPP